MEHLYVYFTVLCPDYDRYSNLEVDACEVGFFARTFGWCEGAILTKHHIRLAQESKLEAFESDHVNLSMPSTIPSGWLMCGLGLLKAAFHLEVTEFNNVSREAQIGRASC